MCIALYAMYTIGGVLLGGVAAVLGALCYFGFKVIIKDNTKNFQAYLDQPAQPTQGGQSQFQPVQNVQQQYPK